MSERKIADQKTRNEARRVMNALQGSDHVRLNKLLEERAGVIKESVKTRLEEIQSFGVFPAERFNREGISFEEPAIYVKDLNGLHVLLFPDGKLSAWDILKFGDKQRIFSYKVVDLDDQTYVLMARDLIWAMGRVLSFALDRDISTTQFSNPSNKAS